MHSLFMVNKTMANLIIFQNWKIYWIVSFQPIFHLMNLVTRSYRKANQMIFTWTTPYMIPYRNFVCWFCNPYTCLILKIRCQKYIKVNVCMITAKHRTFFMNSTKSILLVNMFSFAHLFNYLKVPQLIPQINLIWILSIVTKCLTMKVLTVVTHWTLTKTIRVQLVLELQIIDFILILTTM